MNSLEAMAIYLRVAELNSFTQAADSLGVTKASISGAIKQLETLLGTRLLHRTTRIVKMTHDGLIFYERCRDMLADVEELHTMFQQGDGAISGRLRVDMPIILARDIVIPQLPTFLNIYPRVEVELSSTDRRVDLVREGFDCVIRVGNLSDSSLIARPLGRFHQINCASPDYLRRCGVPQSLGDLSAHKLIHYLPSFGGKPDGFEYRVGEQYRTLEMASTVSVNNSDAYLAACVAGLGIIQTPAIGVRELIEQGKLVTMLPEYLAAPMPVSLVYVNRRHLPKRTQSFMNWIMEIMRPHVS
ncbi:MAG: LysR family transcriptional regulator [Rhodocyclales bacterium]|nr:LysR family transcriptional regulator [Rhodocyclales bacterium]